MNRSRSIFTDASVLQPCFTLRILGTYLLFLWLIGFILNSKILWTFIREEKLRRSPSNIFVFGLIASDVIPIFLELPMSISSTLSCRWRFGNVGCIIEALSAFFTACSNIYIFVFISFDRLLLIQHPHSPNFFTRKRAYMTLAFSYVFASIWVILPLFGWSYYDFEGTGVSCSIKWQKQSSLITSYLVTVFFTVFLCPLVLICIINWKILKSIKFSSLTSIDRQREKRRFLIQQKVAQTIRMVIVGFLACWFPYAIMVFIGGFINPNLISPILTTVLSLFTKTSFVWNSFVYAIRNRNLRPYFYSFDREKGFVGIQWKNHWLCSTFYITYRRILDRPFGRLHIFLVLPSSFSETELVGFGPSIR